MQDNPSQENRTHRSDKKPLSGGAKILVEFGPLLLFFAAFKVGGLMFATAAFILAMGASVFLSKLLSGQVSPMLWINLAVITIMGGLTLALNDERFVKIKPTLILSLFALVLLGGLMRGRLFLKTLMGEAMPNCPLFVWHRITWSFIILLSALAGLNELIWRTQSTDFWVSFKVFGLMPVMLIGTFIILLLWCRPYFNDDEGSENKD